MIGVRDIALNKVISINYLPLSLKHTITELPNCNLKVIIIAFSTVLILAIPHELLAPAYAYEVLSERPLQDASQILPPYPQAE
jgi:hypothetical protein